MIRKIFISALIFFFSILGFGNSTEESWPHQTLKGYIQSITGEKLEYHSPHPDIKSSLLVRSIDASKYIEWETDSIPENIDNNPVSFVWMFGIDVNPEQHHYDLYINNEKYITFSNPIITEKKTWTVTGKNQSELIFRTTMIDKYDDLMGYAILTVPSSSLIRGKRQRIKIIGESANSRVWYMTFQAEIEEKTEIIQYDALVEKNGELFHPVRFQFLHLGKPVKGSVNIENRTITTFKLEPGLNIIETNIQEIQKETSFTAHILIENQKPYDMTFTLNPIRHWTIYLVQHAHTDIGYTRPQTEILPEHLRFIDYALDFCDQTDNYPDDARFRWTCETAWPVREYLRCRPASQVERLKKRIAEGRIEVTGLFLNMSEMLDDHMLAKQLQPLQEFKKHGINISTAMQNDINGVGWGLVDLLSSAGVHYLSMGENTHRALKPFDKPTLFRWESPSGNRILAFRGEHYMLGNNLYLINKNMETFETAMLAYLDSLKKIGYQYDRFPIHFSGYVTDNSPPSTTACDMVKEWNKKYAWPKLRLAISREFFDYMEAHHAAEFPIYKTAWPDWWMDGFGSAARETAFARKAHTQLTANEGLLAMAILAGAKIGENTRENIQRIQDDLIFYDEHTFTAAESISDPTCENTILQWNQKAAYIWDAVKKNSLLREEAMGLIQPFIPRRQIPSLAVFNTLNHPRSGLIEIYIDHEIITPGKKFRIKDETGNIVPAQPLSSRTDGTYWALWVNDIPPLGYKIFDIENETGESISSSPNQQTLDHILENQFYCLALDTQKGSIKNLYDKELKQELTDPACSWQPGQFIYERLGKDRHQLELFKLEEFTRTPWTNIKTDSVYDGSIWKSITLTGTVPQCADKNGISCEIRLYKTEKRIEIKYSMRKLPVTDPEAVYIAFPFTLPQAHIQFDVQGGTVIPGKNQLEHSSSDWNAVQDFTAIRNDNQQIVLVSPEIPLQQFGDINLGKFQKKANPINPYIFSWVLNNYWTTNFLASQEGEFKWSYIITSSPDNTDGFASRFGHDVRVPLLARVIPAGIPNTLPLTASLIQIDFGSVQLVNAEPSSNGNHIIFHLKETNGKPTQVDFSKFLETNKNASIKEVNVLEEEIENISSILNFKPYEVKFVLVR